MDPGLGLLFVGLYCWIGSMLLRSASQCSSFAFRSGANDNNIRPIERSGIALAEEVESAKLHLVFHRTNGNG